MKQLVEIRAYNLNPGCGTGFAALMQAQVLPMLERWHVEVLACGPSPHAPHAWCLVRRYLDLAAREASQDAFYGSDEWRCGPREALLAMIESHASVVFWLDDVAARALAMGLGWGRP